MMVNRYIMERFGLCDKQVRTLLNRAKDLDGVKYFDITMQIRGGAVRATPHFFASELVDALKKKKESMRSDCVKYVESDIFVLEKMMDNGTAQIKLNEALNI